MSAPFKKGDLCWITGCVSHSENVGKSCELVEFLLPGTVFTDPTKAGELLRYVSEFPAWLVVGPSLINRDGEPGFAVVKREHLRRLEGPDVDVATPELAVAA